MNSRIAPIVIVMFGFTGTVIEGGGRALAQGRCVAQDIGTLGGDSAYPTDMNDAGLIVGFSTTNRGLEHAFLFSGGVPIDLGTLGGDESIAHGVNEAGVVVGGSYRADSSFHGFFWFADRMYDAGAPGRDPAWNFSYLTDINDSDQMVGMAAFGPGPSGVRINACLLDGGRYFDLGTLPGFDGSVAYGINNAGYIVGCATRYLAGGTVTECRPVYWNAQLQIRDLGSLGGEYGAALSVNEANQAVGYSENSSRTRQAFVVNLAPGTPPPLIPLGSIDSNRSRAAGINSRGMIVGGTRDSQDLGIRGVGWFRGRVIDLAALPLPTAGARITGVVRVNDARSAVGVWESAGRVRGFSIVCR